MTNIKPTHTEACNTLLIDSGIVKMSVASSVRYKRSSVE